MNKIRIRTNEEQIIELDKEIKELEDVLAWIREKKKELLSKKEIPQ